MPAPDTSPQPPPPHLASAPSLRGIFHAVALLASVPAGIALIASASRATSVVAASIYAASLTGLFAASTAYHRLRGVRVRTRIFLRRLDHSLIFVLIAGTYTPFALLVLEGPWSVAVMTATWVGAAGGILVKLFRFEQWSALGSAMYIVLGWSVVIALPQVARGLSGAGLALLFGGGILYTGGAIVLLTRRPNPSPRVFGYHEIWHLMVVAASACHYAVVHSVVSVA